MVKTILPMYLEPVSAGFPSAAEGYEDEPLDLNELLIRNPAATFYFRVRGDELRTEYIRDGSILVVDRSISPDRGKLILGERDGIFAVERFRPGLPCVVCGVVIAVVLRL